MFENASLVKRPVVPPGLCARALYSPKRQSWFPEPCLLAGVLLHPLPFSLFPSPSTMFNSLAYKPVPDSEETALCALFIKLLPVLGAEACLSHVSGLASCWMTSRQTTRIPARGCLSPESSCLCSAREGNGPESAFVAQGALTS